MMRSATAAVALVGATALAATAFAAPAQGAPDSEGTTEVVPTPRRDGGRRRVELLSRR